MLSIEMLPAEFGDCLWIEYGSGSKIHRVLVDGGTKPTAQLLHDRIEALPSEQRHFDLFVVSHIDADHIDGAVQFLNHPSAGLRFDEVWFNAYKHLPQTGILGAQAGEYLGALLQDLEKNHLTAWNGSFAGNAVSISDSGELPQVTLEGGMRVTVLGPTSSRLKKLRKEWESVMKELSGNVEAAREALRQDRRFKKGWLGAVNVEALATSEFKEDRAVANGSSVVLLIEFEGNRCLLAADAIPSDIVAALPRVPGFAGQARVALSACKIPHHGSRNNNSNELYQMLDCPFFLTSTNGDRYEHPDAEGIARILYNKRRKASLLFNYRSQWNEIWKDDSLCRDYEYESRFPAEKPGMKIEL